MIVLNKRSNLLHCDYGVELEHRESFNEKIIKLVDFLSFQLNVQVLQQTLKRKAFFLSAYLKTIKMLIFGGMKMTVTLQHNRA